MSRSAAATIARIVLAAFVVAGIAACGGDEESEPPGLGHCDAYGPAGAMCVSKTVLERCDEEAGEITQEDCGQNGLICWDTGSDLVHCVGDLSGREEPKIKKKNHSKWF